MGDGYLVVALCYVVFGALVAAFDIRRRHGRGADAITIFIVLFMVQCCLAPIGVYGMLPFVSGAHPTGRPFFDRVYQAADLATAALVLCMAIWFTVSFYMGCALGQVAFRARTASGTENTKRYAVTMYEGRLVAFLVAGVGLTFWSFYLLGNSMLARYTNLVLLRAGWPGVVRTVLNSDALGLTQTWSWLMVLALFVMVERRGWGPHAIVTGVLLAVLSVLGASRRAIFLPILLIYLALVLHTNRWRFRWLMVAAIPVLFWVGVGKDLLAAVAFKHSSVQVLAKGSSHWQGSLLTAASEIGITNVESLATVEFLHLPPRFGQDFLLSIAQRFRFQSLGFKSDFPERIVRISTAAFLSPRDQDIPPGFFGQMWLDFGVFGAIVWGVMFGLALSVVQHFFRRSLKSQCSDALCVLVVFVVAYSANSGSFDFTFSFDVIGLVLVLLACVRVRPAIIPSATSQGPASRGAGWSEHQQ